jgi:hypothetical protein
MAKRTYTYDGSEWVGLASPAVSLDNYPNMTTTPISGFRNAIINGDFSINQRGLTSQITDGGYGFDRWRMYASSGGTYSAQTFTPGAAPVSGYEGKNFARIVTTGQTGAGVYTSIDQPIEDVRTFAGQTVTVSFWARAASGTPKVSIEFLQQFGTGGSGTVFANASAVTLSTSWARYSATIAIPSISGKTIGTNSNLTCAFWVSAGTTFASRTNSIGIQSNTFEFWGVQVEPGTIATPFEQRPIGIEISLCQRYFCSSFPIGTAPTTPALTGSSGGNDLTNYSPTVGNSYSTFKPFPVPMRSSPTLTIYNSEITAIGSWSFYNSSSKNGDFAITSASSNSRGFLIYQAGTHTVSNGGWAASAEL